MIFTEENRRTRRKIYPSATLSTIIRTWTDPGANQGLHDERPATNRLSHGTAYFSVYYGNCVFLNMAKIGYLFLKCRQDLGYSENTVLIRGKKQLNHPVTVLSFS
jgi:hypothetical protein